MVNSLVYTWDMSIGFISVKIWVHATIVMPVIIVMRNKQVLTDKENERAFVDIIENVVGVPIRLRYTSKPISKVESFGEYHSITLGRMKGLDRFTILNHEVGHILFNSPTKTAEDMITKWVKEWKVDLDVIRKVYWYYLNILEDQRIESLMAKLYINNIRRFYKAKIITGRKLDTASKFYPENPTDMVYCVRFGRDDLIEESIMFPSQKEEHDLIKKVFKEVEGTGQRGALIGLVKFKPFIDQYISYQIEHQVPEEEWVGANDLELAYDEVGTVDTSNINHDTFADSWYDGEEQVQNILEKLSGVVDIEKMTTHNMIEDDGDTYVKKGTPIPGIATGMNKLFRNIQEIPKETIWYDGEELDIESYITNKFDIDNIGKCFIDTKYASGISILVSVDGSCSMEDGGYSSMSHARDMVATMYKAIEDINNIYLRAIVWSADLMGVMNITNIKSMNDTNKIRITRDYPTTPTHMAIDYSTKMIKRMKGRKKLLIFITDGSPEYLKDGTFIPPQTLVKMGSNAMIKGLRICNNIMAILIKPTGYSKKCCEDIFGKRLMTVDDMKSGSDIIMNKFKRLVVEVLK